MRGSFCSGNELGEDAHGRGFPGAIGSEECQDLAFLNTKGDTIDRGKVTVAFGDVTNFDHAVGIDGWLGVVLLFVDTARGVANRA